MLRVLAISTGLFTCLVASAGAQYGPGGPQFYGCVAFEHSNFEGAQFPIRGHANIRFVGNFWNDRISSLACSPGCALISFEHINFGGRSQSWSGSVPYVGNRWNDRISSIIVQCG